MPASSILLFALGVYAALSVWMVHAPPRRPGEIAAALFPWSWLAGELPVHHATFVVVTGGALVALGGHATDLGAVGLALAIVGLGGPIASWREASAVGRMAARAIGAAPAHGLSWWRFALPAWFGDRDVMRTHERAGTIELDVYRRRSIRPGPPETGRAPVLVYVHGGGWVLGFRRWQGRLFIRRLVRAGWVVCSIEYRRWPRVQWPTPLDDARAALAWVRVHLDALGGDPARIVLSGNSAGAHLAALVALTDARERGQHPGVAACVGWYGVYDLMDEDGRWPHGALERLWAWLLMGQSKAEAPERWREASPLSHVHAAAPPFVLVHGTHDTLVPIASMRAFAERLEAVTERPVARFEVQGAQHAFDVFTSRRGAFAVEVVLGALDRVVAPSARLEGRR